MNKKKKQICILAILALYTLYAVSANAIVLHFYPDSTLKKVSFSDFSGTSEGIAWIDSLDNVGGIMEEIFISGWAFADTSEPNDSKNISVVFKNTNNNYCYVLENDVVYERADVAKAFSATHAIQGIYHGFRWKFSSINMKSGTYDIYTYVVENDNTIALLKTQYQLTKRGTSVSVIDAA